MDGSKLIASAACQAALAANDGTPFAWDNLRVADVNGRDRDVIPDGQLCSGGKPEFKGLDIVRADWPSTTLRSGTTFTFRYPSTIPHRGSFRLYVTKDGYDPSQPLTWDALETKPFVDVADPPLTNGAYRFGGTLPGGKSGRHLIYTIWQNTSTSDTYYSCSDVVFTAAAQQPPSTRAPAVPAKPAPAPPVAADPGLPRLPAPNGGDTVQPEPGAGEQTPAAPQLAVGAPVPDPSSVAVSTVSVRRPNTLGMSLLAGAIAAVLALGVVIAIRRHRSRHSQH
jgi:chitin-binding protein